LVSGGFFDRVLKKPLLKGLSNSGTEFPIKGQYCLPQLAENQP